MLAALPALVLLCLAAQEVEELREAWPDGTPRTRRAVRIEADGTRIDHGAFQSWYENGSPWITGTYVDGLLEGEWEERFEDRRRKQHGAYAAGRRTGRWRSWHAGGELASDGRYAEGRRVGKWTFKDAEGIVDLERSGSYGFVESHHADGSLRFSGATFQGARQGPWTYRWPGGARMFVGSFEADRHLGEWIFFHRDGTPDPHWITRRFVPPGSGSPAGEGTRERLRSLPDWALQPEDAPEAPATPGPLNEEPAARALLARWESAAGDDAQVQTGELVRLGRGAVAAIVNRIFALDLSLPRDAVLARRLHEELLCEIFGGGWSWSEGGADAVAANALVVRRWDSAWFLLRDDETAWRREFDPALSWLEFDWRRTALGDPPLPATVHHRRTGKSAGTVPPATGVQRAWIRGRRDTLRRQAGGTRLLGMHDAALAWLVRHRARDGSWSAAHFVERCRASRPCTGPGDPRADVGVTSLALLALIGDGQGLFEGKYSSAVTAGVRWLLAHQDRDSGLIRALPEETGELGADVVVQHALATWALADCVHLERPHGPERAAQRALDFLHARQLADGSFPAEADGIAGEVPTTCLVTLALEQCRAAGLEVAPASVRRARSWLLAHARAWRSTHRASALTPNDTATIHALAYLAVLLTGETEADDTEAERLWPTLRAVTGSDDAPMSEIFAGAHAAHQVTGPYWETWDGELRGLLLRAQSRGDAKGSFEPRAGGGGRVASTALGAATVQVYWRWRQSRSSAAKR